MSRSKALKGKSIAILLANGFDESDFTETQKRLFGSGANVNIVSLDTGLISSWHETGWGHHFAADKSASETLAADYDILFVPSGEKSIEKLSQDDHALRIVRGFADNDKPMALSGNAVKLLAESGAAEGRTVTGPSELEADLTKAGADWASDELVTLDQNLLTGQSGEVFVEAMATQFFTANQNQASEKRVKTAA
jgi:protease I